MLESIIPYQGNVTRIQKHFQSIESFLYEYDISPYLPDMGQNREKHSYEMGYRKTDKPLEISSSVISKLSHVFQGS